jgi:hypothetical protein
VPGGDQIGTFEFSLNERLEVICEQVVCFVFELLNTRLQFVNEQPELVVFIFNDICEQTDLKVGTDPELSASRSDG